jgi:hypothetical protein
MRVPEGGAGRRPRGKNYWIYSIHTIVFLATMKGITNP